MVLSFLLYSVGRDEPLLMNPSIANIQSLYAESLTSFGLKLRRLLYTSPLIEPPILRPLQTLPQGNTEIPLLYPVF